MNAPPLQFREGTARVPSGLFAHNTMRTSEISI